MGNGEPARDEFLASVTPSAEYWRTDDTALEAGFVSPLHSYFQFLEQVEDALPAIELLSVDSTSDVILGDQSFCWTMVDCPGGIELLSEDPDVLDRIAELINAHPE